ncbi:site-specific DNA-methyltransferase [Nanoarchaeota archaeon]
MVKKEAELIYDEKAREEDVISDTMSVPFEPVKTFGDIKKDGWHNMLVFGDNLQVLKHLLKMKEEGKLKNPDGSDGVKLIYIDPPFGTGDMYDAKGDAPAYSAKMVGVKFIESLRKRLIFLKELLSNDGSIFVRIDYHFGHYIKILMDEIFDKTNFLNEIVIRRGYVTKSKSNRFLTGTDSLFYYSKSNKHTFNGFKIKRLENERKWRSLEMPGERKTYDKQVRYFEGKPVLPPKGQHWGLSQEKVDMLYKKGEIKLNKRKYIDLKGNKKVGILEFLTGEYYNLDSNWTDIQSYSIPSKWGYPTENSEALLERVIASSSNEGDIVLDCFAGSGTTGAIAEKLGRKWIMCDFGKLSIYTIQKRLLNLKKEIGNKGKSINPKPFIVYNAGLYDYEGFVEKLGEKEYEKFCLELFQINPKNHEVNGFSMQGIRDNAPVYLFRKKNLTEQYIKELHKVIGSYLKDKMFIIAPKNTVKFFQDYIELDGIKYYVLKIPYSIIEDIEKKEFKPLLQPDRKENLNTVVEAVGFDFIEMPTVEAKYYRRINKSKLTENKELIIDITKFNSNQRSNKPKRVPDEEALSMVLVDKNNNEKYFNLTDAFFKHDLEENNRYLTVIEDGKIGKKIMIIYVDLYGNEKREIKDINDFKKKNG